MPLAHTLVTSRAGMYDPPITTAESPDDSTTYETSDYDPAGTIMLVIVSEVIVE